MQDLINSGTTGIFINKAFVNKHYLNTYKLFFPIPVYNIDRITNKIDEISKVVNIVLWYKTYMKWTLLVVLSFDK